MWRTLVSLDLVGQDSAEDVHEHWMSLILLSGQVEFYNGLCDAVDTHTHTRVSYRVMQHARACTHTRV
jgi:hypothetical protein